MAALRVRRSAGLLAAACALGLPGAGWTAPPRPLAAVTITTAPVRSVRGYALTLRIARPKMPSWPLEVEVRLTRTRGSAYERSWWPMYVSRGDLSCDDWYSRCTLDTGNDLKSYGRIRLRFAAVGGLSTDRTPPGCTGSSATRSLRETGTVAFRASSFLAEIRSVPRAASVTASSLDCPRRRRCHKAGFVASGHSNWFSLIAGDRGTSAAAIYDTFPWGLSDRQYTETRAPVPRPHWSVAPDLSVANVDLRGIPFFRGSVAYRASSSASVFASHCGPVSISGGSLVSTGAVVVDGVWLPLRSNSFAYAEVFREN